MNSLPGKATLVFQECADSLQAKINHFFFFEGGLREEMFSIDVWFSDTAYECMSVRVDE